MAYEAKDKPETKSVELFLSGVKPGRRQREAAAMLDLMKRLTGEQPVMWGPSIIGFGAYDYTYASGHSGTSMRVGFSPRKAALTLYLAPGYENKTALLERLGPHETGKSCLYIKDLAKVDAAVLEELICVSIKEMNARYPQKQ
jgi:Domain of unknown function (DU1801)